nr:HRDC domain-containing protein [Saprospiraceae bacterium]
VQRHGYHTMKTFGVGRDIPYLDWKHYISEIINQGFLSIDFAGGSRLQTTPLSKAILTNEARVNLTRFVPSGKKKKARQVQPELTSNPADVLLLEKLRKWRSNLARVQGVPAYVILYNKSIDQIASMKPNSKQQLLSVEGIGQAKLEKYGDQILSMIKESA